MKVLVDYPLTGPAEKLLGQHVDYALTPHPGESPPADAVRDLPRERREVVDVIIGDALKMDGRLFDLLPGLRWIHHFGAGLGGQQVMDWEEIDRRGIAVSTSKIQAQSVSELAVGMLLAYYKKLPEFYRRQGRKIYSDPPGMAMLYDKTALVVGTGNIGREIARKLKLAFDMHVAGVNEDRAVPPCFDEIFGADALDDALPGADIVILSCPYTEKAHHLIDERRLSMMREDALLVNIARGQLVDQRALVSALKERRIGGACLDVFEEEPLLPDDPIWEADNVLITPHLAGVFPSYSEAMVRAFLKNLPYYASGQYRSMPTYANERRY